MCDYRWSNCVCIDSSNDYLLLCQEICRGTIENTTICKGHVQSNGRFNKIGSYDANAKHKGIDVYCNNLNGIDRDYQNMNALSNLLNWKMYPEEGQFVWTEQDIITFIEQRAKEVSDSISDDEITEQYDGFFAVISGHGYRNCIISSDYQLLDKTALHRLVSTNYPQLRDIPRLIVFDCCDGDQTKSAYPAEYDPNGSDEDEKEMDGQGKNFEMTDIKVNQYDEEVWKSDQKNPDYMLALIHAANEGFQAKMNSIDGSYLIYELVKRMIDNVQDNRNLFLGEIFDSIQHDLHYQGKQQITAVFNNKTRYLRFKRHKQGNDGDGKTDLVKS
eukprot:925982_1